MSRRRVALLGSRGIPANYGGFETLMEELAPRLVRRGFEVIVYCRSHHTPRRLREHRGARLVVLPTLRTKYLDTPVHTLLSVLHAWGHRYDAVLLVNGVNAVFAPLLRVAGTPVALNVDGVEKRRAKWGWLGRIAYAVAERLATRLPTALVTDADTIRDHYLDLYGAESTVIRYGVEPRPLPPGPTMERLGLESRNYFLYVSRFEPENNPHRVVQAYARVGGVLPLVMVGDAPYARRFIRSLRTTADPRVCFAGAIYGEGYRELLSHAYAFLQATEVGGTHPALVEAMGYGNCVVVHDTPENRETAGDAALYFDVHEPGSLAGALEGLRTAPEAAVERRRLAATRAAERFSWEEVADAYAALLDSLAAGGRTAG